MTRGELRRVLGLPGAVVVGLGSILGTGLFVALALAADIAGAWAIGAVLLAGLVATGSGLSSARLAAAQPVSGGTYAYGTRLLSPAAGFAAGWLFLAAKSASAATAALGVAAYGLAAAGVSGRLAVTAGALVAVALVTALVLAGLRRTSLVNGVLVAVTVTALMAGVAAMGLAAAADPEGTRSRLAALGTAPDPMTLLHASALAFVAFTGFGRVATLGEEVREPWRTIPQAVVATLAAGGLLALLVVLAGVAAVGPAAFAGAATDDAASRNAVLARVVGDLGAAGRLPEPIASPVRWLLAVGAVTAMLGVLLNLVLGLSRFAFAMGRDRCLPRRLGVAGRGGEPAAAVLVVAGVVAVLVLVGDVSLTWTFSAVTVLAYYGLTNLCALRLPRSPRPVLRVAPWVGLAGCAALAAAVPPAAWAAGLAALGIGFAMRAACRGRGSGDGQASRGGPVGSSDP